GHHAAPGVAVAGDGGEGGRNRCGEPAGQPDYAHGGRASLFVGVDDDGDAVRPGADDRGRPGKLDPAQAVVPEDLPERPTRLSQLRQEWPHPADNLTPACVFEGDEGRFRLSSPSST